MPEFNGLDLLLLAVIILVGALMIWVANLPKVKQWRQAYEDKDNRYKMELCDYGIYGGCYHKANKKPEVCDSCELDWLNSRTGP